MKYLPISELPETYKTEKRMFVVIGINVPITPERNYTSDPYCVWMNEDGTFSRWPHEYEPTHFMELPVIGDKKGGLVKIKDEVTDDELISFCILPCNRKYTFTVDDIYNDDVEDAKYYRWAKIATDKHYVLHIPLEWIESAY